MNEPWKDYWLRQNKDMFSQLCSSMDMVDDADNAIRAYEAGVFPDTKPALYLAVVGALQALVVQQDAVFHLSEALGNKLSFKDYPKLTEIREIRNLSIGHPTKKDRPKDKPMSYSHIIQISLTRHGFELLTFMADGSTTHRYVDMQSIISDQTQVLTEIMESLSQHLEAEAFEHKQRFREEKLTPLL